MGMVFGTIREEMPEFKNHGTIAGLQCREYAPSWVAKVSSESYPEIKEEKEFMTAAFRTLAKYIGVFTTPQNKSGKGGEAIAMTAPVVMTSEAIAMTAPVVMTSEPIAMTAPVVMTSEPIAMTAPVVMSGKTMSFILPSKYIKASEEPPQPLDPRVTLEKIPGRVALVSTFSGSSSPEKAQPHMKECLAAVQREASSLNFLMDGVTNEPKWDFFGYNPPFTLPWCRTNEVAIYLKELPPASLLKA